MTPTNSNVQIPRREFVEEHRRLLGRLKQGSRSELLKEAKSQEAEMSELRRAKGGAKELSRKR